MTCHHCQRAITPTLRARQGYYYVIYRTRWASRQRAWCVACRGFIDRERPPDDVPTIVKVLRGAVT